MKDWRIEFPDFPVEDMPTLPEGWADASWHNDACPSFVNERLKAAIFIDYRDPAMRGLGLEGAARFAVLNINEAGNIETDVEPLAEGDNIDSVLSELNAKRS
jgi:hypothetical protein